MIEVKAVNLYEAWIDLQYALLYHPTYRFEHGRGNWASFMDITLRAEDGFHLATHEHTHRLEARGRINLLAERYLDEDMMQRDHDLLVRSRGMTLPSTPRNQSFAFYFNPKTHSSHSKATIGVKEDRELTGGNCLIGFSLTFSKETVFLDMWQRASEVTRMLIADMRFVRWYVFKLLDEADIDLKGRKMPIRWTISAGNFDYITPLMFFLEDMGLDRFYTFFAEEKVRLEGHLGTGMEHRPWINVLRWSLFSYLNQDKIDGIYAMSKVKRRIKELGGDYAEMVRKYKRGDTFL